MSSFIVGAIHQENLALSLRVREQLPVDFEEADLQRQNRMAELSDHTELARRRFMEVDPSNRRVAATLEVEWESKMKAYEDAVNERESHVEMHKSLCDQELDEKILALAEDFGKVWNAVVTSNEERKRLLRYLIEDVTLIRDGRQVEMKIRLRGGQTQALAPIEVRLPRASVVRRDASP